MKIAGLVFEEIVQVAVRGGGEVSKKAAKFLYHHGARRVGNPDGFEVEWLGKKFLHRRKVGRPGALPLDAVPRAKRYPPG